MTEFNGVDAIYKEIERQNQFINNVYEYLSTNNSEYVDNFNRVINTYTNMAKTFNSSEFSNNENIFKNIEENYNNITNTSIFADKSKGFGGYVEKIVDNVVNNEDIYEVFHKDYSFSENYNSIGEKISNEYKNFTDNIKNIENNNSSEHTSYGVNINMGGITQNISGSDGDDIIDMLVEKLQNALSGCGSRIY